MSRVGKRPIQLPEGVKATILADHIEFEGKKGKLSSPLFPGLKAQLDGQTLVLTRDDDSQQLRALHGLARTLASNAVIGLATGFSKQLEIVGVGYRARIVALTPSGN